jgi:hypothetical protein
MNKEFVPYAEALALKELGFDENTICVYNSFFHLKGCITSSTNGDYIDRDEWDDRLAAPTYSQAFRWFRETHGYNCFITSSILNGKWFYFREDLNDRTKDSEPELTPKFDTFEEAQLECLKQLIGMITLKL